MKRASRIFISGFLQDDIDPFCLRRPDAEVRLLIPEKFSADRETAGMLRRHDGIISLADTPVVAKDFFLALSETDRKD